MKVLITGGAGFIGSHLTDRLIREGARVRILDCLDPQVHGPPANRGGDGVLRNSAGTSGLREGVPGGGGPERFAPRHGGYLGAPWGGSRAPRPSARSAEPPAYLNKSADLFIGDVRDRRAVLEAIDSVDAVVHLAARVGVGQSMYEMADYTSTNGVGTAVLLEAMVDRPVKRLIVASSMSIYGEGRYIAPDGRFVDPSERPRSQLKARQWELTTSRGELLRPAPTPEEKPPTLASVYALSKYDQERLCLMFGAAYRVPTVALRFFNVYGTRQALSNPYTGVLAIFASRLLNRRAPVIFEDGLQRRDFVSVHDVVSACMLALESPRAAGLAINIGSGRSATVRDVAQQLSNVLAGPGVPRDSVGGGASASPTGTECRAEGLLALPAAEISGKYRAGDIRHCFADISRAQKVLGFEPRIDLEEGLAELANWLRNQPAVDRIDAAASELSNRGLTI